MLSTYEILGGYKVTWECIPHEEPIEQTPLHAGRKKSAAIQRAEASRKLTDLFNSYEMGQVFSVSRISQKKKGGVGCDWEIATEFCESLVRDGYAQKAPIMHSIGYRKIANAE
ncbi:MAG: hypothetical protein ACYC0Z_13185 [Acidobacteriaceae bacterium]